MIRGMADYGAEGILLAGAGRALLLQLADPAVGRGVDEHSTFVGRPVNRLKGTLTYVYAVVYGNDEQLNAVRRKVNRAHVPVRRQDTEASPGYNAFDPGLQLWVVATLYDTAVTIIEKIYGPLDDESADAMYQDYARIGTVLQLRPGMWPEDRAAFKRYWDGRYTTLRAEAAGVRVAHGLLYPKHTALWYRAIIPPARFLTAGLLPEQLRQDFGLPWNPRRQRRFDRTFRVLAVAYPRLPRNIRHWFKDYCLAELDKEIRKEIQKGPDQRQGAVRSALP
ncbi:oxygenase MpaB family protein [Arthrobacter sp. AD-310]